MTQHAPDAEVRASYLNPFADPTPLTVCPKCDSKTYLDREIHHGQSQMRECADCGHSMGIPLWYGQPAPAQQVATETADVASRLTGDALP